MALDFGFGSEPPNGMEIAGANCSGRLRQAYERHRAHARKFADGPRNGSVDEVDDGPFAPVQETGELAKVWRGHIVVHGVEIAVIRHIQRVETKPDMMTLALSVLRAKKRNADLAIDLHVQREK